MSEKPENEQFERGVAHFDAREFFEAHEAWEELWLRAAEPQKTFLQGIIQLACVSSLSARKFKRGEVAAGGGDHETGRVSAQPLRD